MVNNPQMVELQKLTAAHFTKETGIKVNFTVLPENDVRDKISQDFANQAGQYDVATLSNYEIPIYARNGWLHPLDSYVAEDKDFDQQDVLEPMRESLTADDGKLYGEPFYGESSFLMYRKDVFAAKGLTMPAHPTWQQVADLAAKVDGARPGMRGICLRGLPGWGELMAPLTTVVNTFGGTWFDKAWKFVSWASSKEYEELVGKESGWSDVPAGKRASTYDNPAYRKEAAAFQEQTKQAIESARPNDPGVQPRPAPGIQFVDIPEFTDLGTKVSQEISAAIAGRQSVETALKKSQKLAAKISKEYEGR
jgi:ABC-type glycerol-3-phosphate transport system substrate-binding protein